MIRGINVENFKCFKNSTNFNLSTINIFSGYNGRGKSTVLQVLLLLAQSYNKNKDIKRLETNGQLCNQGLFNDLISFDSGSKVISFGIHGDIEDAKEIKLGYTEKKDRVGELTSLCVNGVDKFERRSYIGNEGKTSESESKFLTSYPSDINSYFSSVYFVSANRIGPTPFETKEELYEFNPIGSDGKFSLNMLAQDESLRKKISFLLSDIMDGGHIELNGNDDKNLDILSLYIKNLNGKNVRSINSGFGYSYVLPILIDILSISNSILIIENPEAHLHPQAQSRLMRHLARIAKKNSIQLFVETHSEHIVNAVRLSILDEDSTVDSSDVSIYFFDKDMSINELQIDSNAQIKNWPSGFFDQQQNDAEQILKLGLFK